MSETVVLSDELFVREHWDARFESLFDVSQRWPNIPFRDLSKLHGRILAPRPNGGEWILSGNSNCCFEYQHALPEAEAWRQARAFTEDRLEQIRQIEEEIAWIQGFSAYAEHSLYGPCRERILGRLTAALADLKRGMR